MSRKLQLDLFKAPDLRHGGKLKEGKRKTFRPIDSKRPMHVVLHANIARGSWSLLHQRNVKKVRAIVDKTAARFGIKVYNYANVGNHVHLLVKTVNRKGFQSFLRVAPAIIAMKVTGACKGQSMKDLLKARGLRNSSLDQSPRKFWDRLAFSRVVNWGKDYINAQIYFTKNLFEGEGMVYDTPTGPRRFVFAKGGGYVGRPEYS